MENSPQANQEVLQPSVKPKKQKNKLSPKQIFYIVLDAILFPVLIFAMFFSISLIITRATKGVPMVLGYAMVTINSGSMTDAGFEVGMKTFIKSQPLEEYQVGDYVAFFDYVDASCPTPPTVANGDTPTSNPNKNRIVFHEIVEIITDANGNLWYKTKGTNNSMIDKNIIYQDYLIGEYVQEQNFITQIMSFITSTAGILVLIALPCTIILFRDCYELINLIFVYHDQKQLEKKQQKQDDKLLKEGEKNAAKPVVEASSQNQAQENLQEEYISAFVKPHTKNSKNPLDKENL